MKLRKLMEKDAPLMLEWMHDKDVVRHLQADFGSKTMEDCLNFIRYAQDCKEDIHLAIADEEDTYMGTVSLKHINREEKWAEFAITVRSAAMGKGISRYGMEEILRLGLNEYGLDAIYWCVSTENERAVRFYEKGQGVRCDRIPEGIKTKYPEELLRKFIWYVVKK